MLLHRGAHHWVNIEWWSWGMAIRPNPRKGSSLWGAAGIDSCCGAPLPSPSPLPPLLNAKAVRGDWWGHMRRWVTVLCAGGLMMVVSMVTVISLLGYVLVVRAWSSGCAASSTCWQNTTWGWRKEWTKGNSSVADATGAVSDSPPWWSCPSSGRILGGPSAYWSTPPVLRGGLWMGPPRPICTDKRVLVCEGGEEAPLWSSAWQLPLVSPEYPKQRPSMNTHEKQMEKPKVLKYRIIQ